MQRVYSSDSVAMAWHISNVLEQHDIQSEVKNTHLYSGAGEIPLTECWPEVWVKHDRDRTRAEQIIAELNVETEGPDWRCAHCGEPNGSNFDICWQCQAARQPDAGEND